MAQKSIIMRLNNRIPKFPIGRELFPLADAVEYAISMLFNVKCSG
jgi:hypothetical protein